MTSKLGQGDMREQNSRAASSGWGWGAEGAPSPPPRGPSPRRRGGGGAEVVAAVVFVALLGAGVAAFFLLRSDDEASVQPEDVGALERDTDDGEPHDPAPAKKKPAPVSLQTIAWTTETATTLEELARTWGIPKSTLETLNPELSTEAPLEAGTEVVVYVHTVGESVSIGPPNDGRLVRGMPLPEGAAWVLPEDRGRAFATTETITAVVGALEAYGRAFPDAEPVQIGDLSARRGGPIYGHQSHQSGRDIDIRLVLAEGGEGFDADRTWFLLKALVDQGGVREVFLNRSEQGWLEAAAEADLGAAEAARYLELVDHEPGHTIHMHVRFDCPEADKSCVGYSMGSAGEAEEDPPKLPRKASGASKLPGKKASTAPTRKKLTKRKKKKKKKG